MDSMDTSFDLPLQMLEAVAGQSRPPLAPEQTVEEVAPLLQLGLVQAEVEE